MNNITTHRDPFMTAFGQRSILMVSLKYWKIWTISGSAILGATYGLTTSLSLDAADPSLWEAIDPVVRGAAICTSAGAAACRVVEICRRTDEICDQPADRTLCYRGVRY